MSSIVVGLVFWHCTYIPLRRALWSLLIILLSLHGLAHCLYSQVHLHFLPRHVAQPADVNLRRRRCRFRKDGLEADSVRSMRSRERDPGSQQNEAEATKRRSQSTRTAHIPIPSNAVLLTRDFQPSTRVHPMKQSPKEERSSLCQIRMR